MAANAPGLNLLIVQKELEGFYHELVQIQVGGQGCERCDYPGHCSKPCVVELKCHRILNEKAC